MTTKRQRDVLRVIEEHANSGSALSLREIGEKLGLPNVSAVAKHVAALTRKGLLSRREGRSRSLRVMSPLRDLQSRVAHIPVFGSIPAGLPAEQKQEAEGCISVDIVSLGFKPSPNTFALRVTGDSMVGRHILDGDLVILDHGQEPRTGEVVAALIDGQSTLKTFLVKNGKPYLKAENPKYPNLIPAQELMVQGIFKALVRQANP